MIEHMISIISQTYLQNQSQLAKIRSEYAFWEITGKNFTGMISTAEKNGWITREENGNYKLTAPTENE
jgi:predicted transcriptional regulator of viral defense system